MKPLRAPFPYFGGKYHLAETIWDALGNVDLYIEPFAGSIAALLARPAHHLPTKGEIINDLSGHIVNVWRSIKRRPNEVIKELEMLGASDIHTLRAVVKEVRACADGLPESLESSAAWCLPSLAARWMWGQCCCIEPIERQGAGTQHNSSLGQGVRSLTHRDSQTEIINRLADRLKNVRVACGEWSGVLTPAVIRPAAHVGILLDPPYQGNSKGKYKEAACVSDDVQTWALAQTDPRLRIIVCGNPGEYDLPGWRTLERPRGGSRKAKSERLDCLWFSPTCQDDKQMRLDI